MFPKGLGNLSSMLKQAMEIKAKAEQLKEQLAEETVEASVGGGMVKVVLNGRFEMVSITIDPEMINSEDRDALETLIRAGVNEAVRKVQELIQTRMREIAGGLEIPGLL